MHVITDGMLLVYGIVKSYTTLESRKGSSMTLTAGLFIRLNVRSHHSHREALLHTITKQTHPLLPLACSIKMCCGVLPWKHVSRTGLPVVELELLLIQEFMVMQPTDGCIYMSCVWLRFTLIP